MLQSMRNNLKGTVAFIIVGFLAFIMAASLVDLTGTGHHGQGYGSVAEVNGNEISEVELQTALGRERQRLQAQFGNNLPADFLSDERLRGPVLDSLIQRSVLLGKALDGKMTISDSELDEMITRMPEFQNDGVFSPEAFVSGVRRIGHTPTSFRALLRDDLVVNRLRNAMATSAFITDSELEDTVALSRQTRDFTWVSLPLGDLVEKAEVSEEEIQAFFDENKLNYNTEEKVAVEYIELKVADLEPTVEIDQSDIDSQYQQEVSSFTAAAEREAAHIMIEGDDDAAQQKIAEVQEKIAAGDDFAALAAQYSDDFGSKDNGGNLGVSTGNAFPDAFEAALLQLEAGQVSDPVEVDGATHFIKLISVANAEPPTLAESQERIAAELRAIKAEELYLEKLSAVKDLAYNAEALSEVAEPLDLTVGTTDTFTRNGNDEPILRDSRVLSAAYSEQVLQQGFTSDVIEIAPNHAVVINLIKHEPVRPLTLDEKRDDIVAELKETKAKEQLAQQSENLRSALAAGTSLETLAAENTLTLNTEVAVNRESRAQPVELVEHVFSLARPQSEPVTSAFYLANNDYALISLAAVNDAEINSLTDEERRGALLSLGRSVSSNEYLAWQARLVEQADVEVEEATY